MQRFDFSFTFILRVEVTDIDCWFSRRKFLHMQITTFFFFKNSSLLCSLFLLLMRLACRLGIIDQLVVSKKVDQTVRETVSFIIYGALCFFLALFSPLSVSLFLFLNP